MRAECGNQLKKHTLKDKPWYFIFAVLSFFIKPVSNWLIMRAFDVDSVNAWLEKRIEIRISDIVYGIIILSVVTYCILRFMSNRRKLKNKAISTDSRRLLQIEVSNLLENSNYFESVQIYQYSLKNMANVKCLKINFLLGVADEQVEINSIMQGYFYFPYKIFKKIQIFAGKYEAWKKSVDPIKESDLYIEFMTYGVELCKILSDCINDIKNVSDVKPEDCEIYRIFTCIFSILQECKDDSEIAILSTIKDKEIENRLLEMKKTGLVGSVLLGDIHIFKNSSSHYKNGRLYFAIPLAKVGKLDRLICLVSINPQVDENIPILEKYCTGKIDNLNQHLKEKVMTDI